MNLRGRGGEFSLTKQEDRMGEGKLSKMGDGGGGMRRDVLSHVFSSSHFKSLNKLKFTFQVSHSLF